MVNSPFSSLEISSSALFSRDFCVVFICSYFSFIHSQLHQCFAEQQCGNLIVIRSLLNVRQFFFHCFEHTIKQLFAMLPIARNGPSIELLQLPDCEDVPHPAWPGQGWLSVPASACSWARFRIASAFSFASALICSASSRASVRMARSSISISCASVFINNYPIYRLSH